jgi:transcriptional regulator with XRE-family HTH domain
MKKSVHTPQYAWLRGELRGIREAAGLSQRALANRLRVPHSWVAKVENGERRLDILEMIWFVSACGAEPSKAFSRLLERTVRQPKRPSGGGRGK